MKKLPTILLTGFAPFDGQSLNPSWEAVRALQGKRIAGHRIVARCLPVAFDASLKQLRAALRETSPEMVICVGLAGGRERISLERIAINVDDARIADNEGRQPIDEAIVVDGPAAYFSTLPIKSMLAGLRDAGFPVEVSQTAGTYVCNHVFYGLMHALRSRRKVRAGFIHVPYSPEQAAAIAGAPGLALETVIDALRLALRIAMDTPIDQRIGAGTEH
ncbi:pyroglutamyl-peptidase I [Pseudoxanthomonas yeongjuensis]|uniref:pyroglutamyl-peptidase I n=1 Tax=Pseudoxanthomonas yeongjuensis TaxID=377616 RepID=UPI001390C982|nr:pyroglutamyl-peptidase I [Pseudoxanthomonas yeongjuensis]KAF1718143.1 pyroglutamyl-peptidase I [Pseudoxanthomonas yeongjuensis]